MKTLRYFFVAALAMVVGNAFAADVTDELTWQALGLDGTTNQYKDYSGIKLTSTAVYAGQMSSGGGTNGGKYIQLRTNNNNAGIVTTTSGGKLKSVTITFNEATTDRAIEIYGKNEAYAAATDLYDADKQGTKLASIAANADSKTLTVDGDYTFVGLKSANGAIYVDKIEITWAAEGGSSAGGDVEVGIVRPLVNNQENVYDDFAFITTENFNKSVTGLTAKFFETDAIKSTIVEDKTTESGYEKKNVCHQGVKDISCDYVWKLNCADFDSSLKRHKNETLGSEGWAFGFDLTVAEGCTFAVNAIDFDLLVEQNPSYRIRIMKGETELYNSTWVTKTGGYNNEQWASGSYCRITKDDVSFFFEKKDTEGNPINYQGVALNPGFEEGVGVKTPLPADFKLEAGTYRVIADVDFNKDSAKAMSFDNFTLEGTLTAGGADGIQSVAAGKAVKADNVMYNLAGQKVGADYKGLVIMNGKKVVIK